MYAQCLCFRSFCGLRRRVVSVSCIRLRMDCEDLENSHPELPVASNQCLSGRHAREVYQVSSPTSACRHPSHGQDEGAAVLRRQLWDCFMGTTHSTRKQRAINSTYFARVKTCSVACFVSWAQLVATSPDTKGR